MRIMAGQASRNSGSLLVQVFGFGKAMALLAEAVIVLFEQGVLGRSVRIMAGKTVPVFIRRMLHGVRVRKVALFTGHGQRQT